MTAQSYHTRNTTPAAHTYAEIADIFGMSVSSVKQIEGRAFRKMRRYLKENPELEQELLEELEEVTG